MIIQRFQAKLMILIKTWYIHQNNYDDGLITASIDF